ncbi:MAG: hypothetical protein KatS3mg088_307 [Patescibacteria group bacterium]|nr:MAG: hypothetical protein KatS3mg088_307 [Patescibacteria group bacterium]
MRKEPFNFKGLYFTKHALERLNERGFKLSDVWAVWHNPQSSRYAASKGAYIYWRKFGNIKVEVVAKKDERGRWIVISLWAKQIYHSEKVSFLSLVLDKIKSFF